MNQTRWTIVVACVAFALASARSWAETKSGFNLNPFAKFLGFEAGFQWIQTALAVARIRSEESHETFHEPSA